MADYEPGHMNINEQRDTYDSFWRLTIRTSIGVAVILVLMYIFLG
ncbi:MAG: aa3-type cytochrome c oxidase subunit IV [Pseudomonadota bacterium]